MSAYTDLILSDSPLAYWPLDDAGGSSSVQDLTGHGYSGVPAGGVSLGNIDSPPGPLDGTTCASFNGSTGYIGITQTSGLPTTTAYSMEGWIKLGGTGGGGYGTIVMYGNNALDHLNGLIIQSTNKPFINWWGDDYFVTTGSLVGSWHHVACTWTGSIRTLYLDGTSIGLQFRTSLTADQTHFALGSRRVDNNLFFNGSMEHVALYGTALSASRIHAHYAAATYTGYVASGTHTQITVPGNSSGPPTPTGGLTGPAHAVQARDPRGWLLWRNDGKTFTVYSGGVVVATFS